MENLQEQYNQIEFEWKRYFKDDFIRIFDLLEDGLSIEKAIVEAGVNYNTKDFYNLKRCVEILNQWTKFVTDNSEAILNEEINVDYNIFIALANKKLKNNIIFKDIKKEDESLDDMFMLEKHKCDLELYTYYIKLQKYNIDKFLGNEWMKTVMLSLNGACSFIKENNQCPIGVKNKLIDLIALYNTVKYSESCLIVILQGLIEWIDEVYNNSHQKVNIKAIYKWILKQAVPLYAYYYHHCYDNQNENDFDTFFFSTMIGKEIKEHDNENSKENIGDDDYISEINEELTKKIYSKCNKKQWDDISMKDFIKLLNCDNTIKLSIKKNESNRTKVVFKNIANSIKDKGSRKKWIEFIKKEVFDNVDFMKATLRTDTSCEGYSQIDINFSSFIADLGVSPINKKTPQ